MSAITKHTKKFEEAIATKNLLQSQRILLLELWLNADEDGEVIAGVKQLLGWTGYSTPVTMFKARKELVRRGIIRMEQTDGHGQPTHYLLSDNGRPSKRKQS